MAPKSEMSSSEIDAKITEFEKRLDRLYRQYEQYFIGIEKRPPRNERRQVTRLFRELDNLPMIKTAVKFRFRSLVQRFNSYKSYWNRVERQIEQGTYHRDLARAKARKQRREDHEERQQQEQDGRADDGAFEIDDLDLEELDLEAMERELQEMDQRGEFEKYVGTAKMKRGEFPEDKPADGERPKRERQNSWQPHQVDENVKQKRLAELQAKLGLSSRGSSDGAAEQPSSQPPPRPAGSQADGANNPFERSKEGPTQKARPENPSAPGRGADISKLKKLRRAKEKLERQKREAARGGGKRDGSPNRVIRRNNRSQSGGSKSGSTSGGSGDEHSRKIYNSLVKAKRRCNEDTSNLNYDSFKRTMDRQRTQIQKKKGARDVDFKVVIKDGRAFLKPETKK